MILVSTFLATLSCPSSSGNIQDVGRDMCRKASVLVQVSIARVYNYDLMQKKGLPKEGQSP